MTSLALARPVASETRPRLIGAAAVSVAGLLLAAGARHFAGFGPATPGRLSPWLIVHLATVLPALPLGAYVLIRRKGDRRHRLLGRVWALLMLITAIVSFGVQSQGHLSFIHLFSVLVLVTVPRGVLKAMRGDIAGHRRAMLGVYIGLIAAGLFTFVPGRLFGLWLFG